MEMRTMAEPTPPSSRDEPQPSRYRHAALRNLDAICDNARALDYPQVVGCLVAQFVRQGLDTIAAALHAGRRPP
jgi:hypothetical protein